MRINKYVLVAGALALVMLFFVCKSPSINTWDIPKAATTDRIIFFGDSLTTGFGLQDKKDSYPNRVCKKLNKELILYGFNGYTTQDALAKLPLLKNEPPSLVVVTLGGNDILRSRDLKTTGNNLRTIFTELKKMNHTIVFTEVLSFFDSKRHNMYVELCKEMNIAMVPDLLDGLLSSVEAMQADTIHPAPLGCEAIANKVVGVLQEFHFN